MHDLANEELFAQAGHRSAYALDGPPVSLAPKAAEVLALALHELATNSVKYGVLGDARDIGGTVHVRWEVVQEGGPDWLDLRWREPTRAGETASLEPGFGTELITQRVPYELRGRASLTIGAREIAARIEFPLVDSSSLLETSAPGGAAS